MTLENQRQPEELVLTERTRDYVDRVLCMLSEHGVNDPNVIIEHLGRLLLGVRSDDADSLDEMLIEEGGRLGLDGPDDVEAALDYVLSKQGAPRAVGQHLTPHHLVRMMVALVDPAADDIICDPACGTGRLLVAAGEHALANNPAGGSPKLYGFDIDDAMVNVAKVNLAARGLSPANIKQADSLAESSWASAVSRLTGRVTLFVGNPPFAEVDAAAVGDDLPETLGGCTAGYVRTELLFLALSLRLLRPGGRAAVIVPAGVLYRSSEPHKALRRHLVDDHALEAVVSIPQGVFLPDTGVTTVMLLFKKGGQTGDIFFYDLRADGRSLDFRRRPIEENEIPDLLARWRARSHGAETDRDGKSFFVEKAEVEAADYDLSMHRFRPATQTEAEFEPAPIIRERLRALEEEVAAELEAIEALDQVPTTTWPTTPLREVGRWRAGGTPSRREPAYWEGGTIPWATEGDLKSFALAETRDHLTPMGAKRHGTLPAGTVMFVIHGKTLKSEFRVGVATREVATNQSLKAIIPNGAVSGWFLAYYLRHLEPHVLKMVERTSHGGRKLAPRRMQAIPVPVPPAPLQERIVRLLGHADAVVAKRVEAADLVDQLRRSVFLEAFDAPDVTGWLRTRLGDLLDEPPKNGLYRPASDYSSIGIPIIKGDSYDTGFLRGGDRQRLILGDDAIGLNGVEVGDVLVNRVNSRHQLGKVLLVPDLDEPTVFGGDLIRLRLDRTRVTPSYLSGALEFGPAREELLRRAKHAVNQSSVNQRDLLALEVPIPPMRLQLSFEAEDRQLRHLRDEMQRALLSEARDLRRSLAERAFAGTPPPA